MTNEVHGNTKKAADLALAKRAISPDSHKAIHAGELSLEEARELGRNAGPSGPAVRADKNDRSRPCIACGGTTKGGRFHPGCDMKMYRIAREALAGERELTEEQHAYLEESGKMAQVVEKAKAEDRKREEVAARKAEAQREREGEAEAKRSGK
jgi:hypothetical protein